jgi:hypothetical protein
VTSRVAGFGSRGWFFLSVFGRCGTGAEAEAVIPGLKDVAVVRKSIEQSGISYPRSDARGCRMP